LSTSLGGLERREIGIHIQGLYALPLTAKTRLMLAAGPSIFTARDDLVRSIEFENLPGFTGVKFDQAQVVTLEKTVVGFNVGANVIWAVASHFGISAVTRYSRAQLMFDPGSEANVNRSIELHAGGLQIGGGIRVFFQLRGRQIMRGQPRANVGSSSALFGALRVMTSAGAGTRIRNE
jgi:hypothetical protein